MSVDRVADEVLAQLAQLKNTKAQAQASLGVCTVDKSFTHTQCI
jgi:hypothetical protein